MTESIRQRYLSVFCYFCVNSALYPCLSFHILYTFLVITIVFQSMLNFLRDPTGDTPWEEDTTAKDVVHVTSYDVSYVM